MLVDKRAWYDTWQQAVSVEGRTQGAEHMQQLDDLPSRAVHLSSQLPCISARALPLCSSSLTSTTTNSILRLTREYRYNAYAVLSYLCEGVYNPRIHPGLILRDNPAAVGEYTANYICKRIKEFNPSANRPFVLGLPTGSSPIPTYKALIKMVKEGKLS